MAKLIKALAVVTALAGLAAMPVMQADAQEPPKKAAKKAAKKATPKKVSANCQRKGGRGWAPTEAMARFQAWEIVAQTTGNWPIMTDTFKNEVYRCKPDGSQWMCLSWIDVCKKR